MLPYNTVPGIDVTGIDLIPSRDSSIILKSAMSLLPETRTKVYGGAGSTNILPDKQFCLSIGPHVFKPPTTPNPLL
jgi:hypothetical protein